MSPEPFPPPTWQTILDCYEVDWADVGEHGGLDHEYTIAMADFVRAVMTCAGHDRLVPGTSLMRLFVAGRTDGLLPGDYRSPGVWWHRRAGFEITRYDAADRPVVVTRRSVHKAVRVFRRMLWKVGLRLGPPRWEQPPAECYRRAWLVFPCGRMG